VGSWSNQTYKAQKGGLLRRLVCLPAKSGVGAAKRSGRLLFMKK
jgi:hypothetical protein